MPECVIGQRAAGGSLDAEESMQLSSQKGFCQSPG